MAFFPSEDNSTSSPPANRLSQYDSENPIIHEQTVSDKSKGLEAISKTLGGVSELALKHAESLGEQESNAMYVQSQVQLDTIKSNAKIDMIKNPGQADKIADKTAETYSSIVQQSVVNKSDRQKLMKTAADQLNDLRVDGARATFDVAKNQARINFYSGWPDVLKGIKSSVGHEKEFERRIKATNELLATMGRNKIITPTQLGNAYESLHAAIDSAQQYQRAVADNSLTARDYHQIKGGVIPVDDGTHMGQPVDHNTLHLYTAQSGDLTKETLEAEIAAGGNGNPLAWGQLTDKSVESDEMFSFAHGAHSVYAELNAGVPLSQLQNEAKKLQGNIKSTEQRGRYAALKSVLSDAGAGYVDKLLANNPIWREVAYGYNQAIAAVDSSAQSPQQKEQLHQFYFNNLVWKRQSLMDAMHVPSELQHPLPREFVESSKTAWALDKDPAPLLVASDHLQADLKDYLATAQDTPIHQETTRLIANLKADTVPGGLLSGNSRTTDGDRRNWVMAQQNGRSFADLKITTPQDEQPIIQDIQDKIGDTLRFVSRQSGSQTRGVALVKSATNYVKYIAQQSGDFTLKNKNDYVEKAAAMINEANKVEKGTNWTVNPNVIPTENMDNIASHLIEEQQARINERFGHDRGMVMTAANSLSVVNTPNGHLAVIDAYGNKLYETRHNGRMDHYIEHVNNEKQKKIMASQPKNPNQIIEQENESIDQDLKATEKAREKGKKQHQRLVKSLEKEKSNA